MPNSTFRIKRKTGKERTMLKGEDKERISFLEVFLKLEKGKIENIEGVETLVYVTWIESRNLEGCRLYPKIVRSKENLQECT